MIALVNCEKFLKKESVDPYIKQILLEDQLLIDAFCKQGITAERVSWDDTNIDWSLYSTILLRSAWDYMERIEEFHSWLKINVVRERLINPVNIVEWNMDKKYLLELQDKNIPIVPTKIVRDSLSYDKEEFNMNYPNGAILKRSIGAGGVGMFRLTNENLFDQLYEFNNQEFNGDYLIQPFMSSVQEFGEVSLVYLHGVFSHAIKKIAKEGDYRVQDDYGGTFELYKPSKEEMEFGDKVMNTLSSDVSYARIDYLNESNALLLSELELIEPELWFRLKPESADQFVKKLINNL